MPNSRHRRTLIVLAVVVLAIGANPAWTLGESQPSGLKIAVIAGEDAVNIIQQKTAVAPIVEVRDRNDQPVAGAVVSFAVRSGRATFDGARTLSVTTDVVGRAVASGLTPTGTGALQISASAAFQGQTVAVTIAQTNVMTAAQAAAIGGAASSGGAGSAGGAGTAAGTGGAAAGGGGINGLTLGLLGAGAGAGALVAIKASGDSATSSAPTSSAPPPPTQPPVTPLPSNVLYDIVMTPAVSTAAQCPGAPAVPGAGPVGTAVSLNSDGTMGGDLSLGVSGGPPTFVTRISGRWTATDVTATLFCIAGGGPTGSLSGNGSAARYTGSWNFGSIGGTFVLTPK